MNVPDQRELEALYTLLDDPDESVQAEIIRRFLALGDEAIEPMHTLDALNEQRNKDRLDDVMRIIRVDAATKRLGGLVEDPTQFDLESAVFTIARFGYPSTDTRRYRNELNAIAEDVSSLANRESDPAILFDHLRSHLFSVLGFSGNRSDYRDPDNSYMNRVLDRRLGLPITLSLVMLFCGERLNIPLRGIGMPMHFLLEFDGGSRRYFIDAFNNGMLISREQCRQILINNGFRFTDEMLAPISSRAIVERLLRNLLLSYRFLNQRKEMIAVASLLAVLNPTSVEEFENFESLSNAEDDDE